MAEYNSQQQSKLRLYIPREIYQKCMHFVNKSNFEVSWFGSLYYDKKDNYFVVQKIWLLKQENASAETEIDGAALADLLFDVKDEPFDLKWWAHSHVNMGVFWSSTDRETMKMLSKNGWFLSTVFNKKNEMRTALDMNIPGQIFPIFMDNVETIVFDFIPEEKEKEWDKEYNDNVKIKHQSYEWYGKGSKKYTKEDFEAFEQKKKAWEDYLNSNGKDRVFSIENKSEKKERPIAGMEDDEWDEQIALFNAHRAVNKQVDANEPKYAKNGPIDNQINSKKEERAERKILPLKSDSPLAQRIQATKDASKKEDV